LTLNGIKALDEHRNTNESKSTKAKEGKRQRDKEQHQLNKIPFSLVLLLTLEITHATYKPLTIQNYG
jgi:hypothetical protein